jgi:hypothetical protein
VVEAGQAGAGAKAEKRRITLRVRPVAKGTRTLVPLLLQLRALLMQRLAKRAATEVEAKAGIGGTGEVAVVDEAARVRVPQRAILLLLRLLQVGTRHKSGMYLYVLAFDIALYFIHMVGFSCMGLLDRMAMLYTRRGRH